MCIVLLQDGIPCIFLSGPLDVSYHSILGFPCWFFVWMTSLLMVEKNWSVHHHCVGVYLCF
jgi:hypothetical protein